MCTDTWRAVCDDGALDVRDGRGALEDGRRSRRTLQLSLVPGDGTVAASGEDGVDPADLRLGDGLQVLGLQHGDPRKLDAAFPDQRFAVGEPLDQQVPPRGQQVLSGP
ncbi:hypothetical protein OHA72_27280 [Dactylosporangium sp. NBC_01737]|nr:hypothetical protein OHA72_27280 [Dactylosporangium sp. NBC_01737]